MKISILIIFLLSPFLSWAQGKEWHVKPSISDNANTLGDGLTFETAWSIQNALNNPNNVIQHGDIIWLHGGEYKGRFTASAALNGTPTDYIKVKSYPGEWAKIDGNTDSYVSPPQNAINSPSSPNEIPTTVFEELATNLDDEVSTVILSIKSKFVQYENFEITCIGPINRLSVRDVYDVENCEPTNGFKALKGLNENPTREAHTINRYANIVIRNIPGHAMGSWKFSDNSEIYGCVFYNNGYILKLKNGDCTNNNYHIIGRGSGIYTQNASSDPSVQRIIKNNIFANNYDSGILVWSASELPPEDYVKNYTISKNIFINNGGPQRDNTANIIVSTDSQNNWNHPSNINLDNNIFYINSRANYVSGIHLWNTQGVTMHHNFIYKGTSGVCFEGDNGRLKLDEITPYNNSNINFNNNFYFGKHIQPLSSSANYLNNNWYLNNNTYYTKQEGPNDPYYEMFEVDKSPQVRYPLSNFQNLYGGELSSHQFHATYYGDGTEYLGAVSLSPKITITQNEYDTNRFYITIFNPNATNPSFDNIAVNFSAYNIPSGTSYKIRDPQNYFGIPISGVYNNGVTTNTIIFPMTLTSIEIPTGILGIDYTTTPVHSLKDMGVFIVEFGCPNIPYDINKNSLDIGTQNYRAKNNVFFNSGYIADTNSIIDARANRSIVLKSNTLIKGSAKFLGMIESTCLDLSFVGEQGNFNRDVIEENTNSESKPINNFLNIYPNPSTGIFTIENSQPNTISKVNISNANSAELILSQEYTNEVKVNIDISSASKGLYIIQVTFKDGSTKTRTIAKK